MTIRDLEPKLVWNNFYELTRLPRPSKHEEKVREFLIQWGKDHNIETIADKTGNVIFRKPATPGFENRRGVIFQGHMDMVPQKVASSNHDFLKDPIETEVLGEWVGAKGTTLGADNGIGIALGMAVLESKDLQHGPVEVICTYDEETGMTGAENLEPGLLKGDILINLDSEDEGELCIGCAGGLDAIAEFSYKTLKTPAGFVGYKIGVKGLQGGHSGMDISLYRGNANKILARAVIPTIENLCALVSDFSGGSLRNAIPYEAEAHLIIPAGNEETFEKMVAKVFSDAKARYAESDPNMETYCEKETASAEYIETDAILRALKSVVICPSNVIRMSQSMAGLTETSTNLAIVRCENGKIKVASLMRSALDSSKADLALRLKYIFELAGADIRFEGGYPGWLPQPDLPIIKLMCDTYKKMFGKDMVVNATHGGLECAILGAKYTNWEMVSIGPTVVHPHSPDERLKIDTVQMTWDYLEELLKQIPNK